MVHERDEIARGHRHAETPRSRTAPVLDAFQNDLVLKSGQDGGGVILRTVIDDDDLVRRVSLVQDALDRLGDERRAVINRYDDGEPDSWKRCVIHWFSHPF